MERKEAIIELVQTEINYGNDLQILKEVNDSTYELLSVCDTRIVLIENDHLEDWSPKDCCWPLIFRQTVRNPSPESNSVVVQ